MMKHIALNEIEIEALRGLSHLAVRLYLVLRWSMDAISRMAGLIRRLSLQALREETEVATPRNSGYQRDAPTEKEVRIALAALERGGLIQQIQKGQLVFSMPLASTPKIRPKNTGHEPDTVFDEEKPYESIAYKDTGHDKTAIPGTHKDKGFKCLKATASRAKRLVDNLSTEAAFFEENHYESTARLVDKLSTSLDIQAEAAVVADFLKSVCRKNQINIVFNDPSTLARWVAAGTPLDYLEIACKAAKKARDRDGSTAPLFPKYIDCFLAVMPVPPQAWHETWSGIEAKGESLGLFRADGEAYPAFKARVFKAAGEDLQ